MIDRWLKWGPSWRKKRNQERVRKDSVGSEWSQAKHSNIHVTYMYEDATVKLSSFYISLKKLIKKPKRKHTALSVYLLLKLFPSHSVSKETHKHKASCLCGAQCLQYQTCSFKIYFAIYGNSHMWCFG